MPKPYDDAIKKLVGGNPQDLVSWVIPGAQFGKQLPFELSVECNVRGYLAGYTRVSRGAGGRRRKRSGKGFGEGARDATSDTTGYCSRAFSRDCTSGKTTSRYHRRP